MTSKFVSSFLALSCLVTVGEAQDGLPIEAAKSYVLAGEKENLPIGSIIETTGLSSMKEADITMTLQEEVMDGKMLMVEEEHEKVEVLGDKKHRYTLVKSESKQKMVLAGNPIPIPKKEEGLLGKSVIVTLKDGQWTSALEEGEANAAEKEELEDLNERYNNDTDLKAYGNTPRKIGDEWESDGAEVMRVEDMVGKIKFKFARVEKYQGVECAVLTCSFKVTGTDEDLEGMEMTIKGTATIYRSLRDLEDIKADFKGQMFMNGVMSPEPGFDLKMKMKGPMTMKYTTKVTRP